VLAALSTGHQIGLGVSGLAFVIFALVSAMLIPRSRPDFPGDKFGMFLAVCFVFFVGMLAAVFIFGKESSPPEKHHEASARAL
jgi:NO-binding membrane sensor protein with MHYT domain